MKATKQELESEVKRLQEELRRARESVTMLQGELKESKEKAHTAAEIKAMEHTNTLHKLECSEDAVHGLRAQISILERVLRNLFEVVAESRKIAR